MDVICVRILLCISFLRYIALSAGFNIVTSTFRLRGKLHDKDSIRKCAMKVLQNTTVIGGRISDSTGHCEELTHSLAQNQNQSGYGHVDRINFIKAFQPAIPSSGPAEDFAAMLPLPLSMMSKVEVTLDRTPPSNLIYEERNEFRFTSASVKEEPVAYKWVTFCRLSKCKLTFVIHDWGIKVLANDQKITEITSVQMPSLLQGLKRVTFYIGTNGVKLRRLEVQR